MYEVNREKSIYSCVTYICSSWVYPDLIAFIDDSN